MLLLDRGRNAASQHEHASSSEGEEESSKLMTHHNGRPRGARSAIAEAAQTGKQEKSKSVDLLHLELGNISLKDDFLTAVAQMGVVVTAPALTRQSGEAAADRPTFLPKRSSKQSVASGASAKVGAPPDESQSPQEGGGADVEGGKAATLQTGSQPQLVDTVSPTAQDLVHAVLHVIPDVEVEWAIATLSAYLEQLQDTPSTTPGADAVALVIDDAFEMEQGYPVADYYADKEYRAEQRKGPGYQQQALKTSGMLFEEVPPAHIYEVFNEEGTRLLVPTFFVLRRESQLEDKLLVSPPPSPTDMVCESAMEAIRESRYLHSLIAERNAKAAQESKARQARADADVALKRRQEKAKQTGIAIECGCCFDHYDPVDTVECQFGHAFCRGCVIQYANSKLGEGSAIMKCISTAGCGSEYSDHTLRTVLPETTLSHYHRVHQAAELEAARLRGLESCPHCPYAVVIDNPLERLFNCLNPECRQVTCSACRRLNHLPRRCAEVEADEKLDERHVIEEAMSAALVRKCPKCNCPFVKLEGPFCNKIYCQCGTTCCYTCGKQVDRLGYDHFVEDMGGKRDQKLCYIWPPRHGDNVEDDRKVQAAREEAEKRLQEAVKV